MSYISVEAEKVRIAAQSMIDHIESRRKEKDEGMITRKMCERKWLFWKGYYTREEAIDILLGEEFTIFPSCYAWGDLDKAEKLLILAQNGDSVMIDNEEAYLLWGK